MFNYNILLATILVLIIIYFLLPNNNIMGKTKFVKINNKLDKEHDMIFKKLDELYDCCAKHWKTEKKMYEQGCKKMPAGHIDVRNEWKEHENEHKALLKEIKNMKKNIVNHIKIQDKKHIHWTQ